MTKITARARRDNCRQITGFTVENIVAAVRGIEPRNLGIGNLRPIGINGGFIEIDRNLPRGAAHWIGAGDRDRGLARPPLTVDHRGGQTCCQAGHAYRQHWDL